MWNDAAEGWWRSVGLTGTQKAYRLAIASTARAASTRSGYFPRDVVPIWINGVACRTVVQSSIRIDLNTGAEPHRCAFDIKGGYGFVPQVGHAVTIGHGSTDNPLFSGRILKCERIALRAADSRVLYRCDATGHMFDMSAARLGEGFRASSMTPRSIVQAVLSLSSPNLASEGFTIGSIDANLDRVVRYDIGPTEDIAESFGKLFDDIGATWTIDHKRRIIASTSLYVGQNTLTNTSDVSRFSYTPRDGSRMFTRVEVLGASARTVWPATPDYESSVPISSGSLLAQSVTLTSSMLPYVLSQEDYLLGTSRLQGSVIYRGESFPSGPSYVVLPVSANANSILVGASNVSSQPPIFDQMWYGVNDKFVFINSTIGIASVVANPPYSTNIIYAYWANDDGPGGVGDGIGSMTILQGVWNLTIGGLDPDAPNYHWIDEDTPVRVLVSRTNTPGVNAVTSLFGTGHGVINRTIDGGDLTPDQAVQVALEALDRGDPTKTEAVAFESRTAIQPGELVFVSMTSLAESGVSSIAGTFTAHDVTIDGFGNLSDTLGPVRTVSGGYARRPTLWSILRGL